MKDAIISLLHHDASADFINKIGKLWDWKFEQNPFSAGSSFSVILSEDSSILGFIGAMPVLVKYGSAFIQALWACDVFVHPSCRGKGLGVRLNDELKAKRQIAIVFGTNDAGARNIAKSGWIFNKDVAEYYYTNAIKAFKDIMKVAIQKTNFIRHFRTRKKFHYSGNVHVRMIDAVIAPKDIDALWENVKFGYKKIVVRNYDYINWKYGSHPSIKYRMMLVESDKNLLGVGIFRKTPKIGRLVDYIGPAQDIGLKFLLSLSFFKACSDCDFLSATFADEEFQTCFRALGFRRSANNPRFAISSSLIHDSDPEKDWFIMAGDSDGDMMAF